MNNDFILTSNLIFLLPSFMACRKGYYLSSILYFTVCYISYKYHYTNEEIEHLLVTIRKKTTSHHDYQSLFNYLTSCLEHYKKTYKIADSKKNAIIQSMHQANDNLKSKLEVLKNENKISSKEFRKYRKFIGRLKAYNFHKFKVKHNNHSLEDFVTNSNSLNFITEDANSLIQKSDPIYLEPYTHTYLGGHFYAPCKFLFNWKLDTFVANLIVIWFMTLLLIFTLYFDLLRKFLEKTGHIFKIIKEKISVNNSSA